MLVGEADGGVPLSAAAYQQLQVDATPPLSPLPAYSPARPEALETHYRTSQSAAAACYHDKLFVTWRNASGTSCARRRAVSSREPPSQASTATTSGLRRAACASTAIARTDGGSCSRSRSRAVCVGAPAAASPTCPCAAAARRDALASTSWTTTAWVAAAGVAAAAATRHPSDATAV